MAMGRSLVCFHLGVGRVALLPHQPPPPRPVSLQLPAEGARGSWLLRARLPPPTRLTCTMGVVAQLCHPRLGTEGAPHAPKGSVLGERAAPSQGPFSRAQESDAGINRWLRAFSLPWRISAAWFDELI